MTLVSGTAPLKRDVIRSGLEPVQLYVWWKSPPWNENHHWNEGWNQSTTEQRRSTTKVSFLFSDWLLWNRIIQINFLLWSKWIFHRSAENLSNSIRLMWAPELRCSLTDTKNLDTFNLHNKQIKVSATHFPNLQIWSLRSALIQFTSPSYGLPTKCSQITRQSFPLIIWLKSRQLHNTDEDLQHWKWHWPKAVVFHAKHGC